MSDIPQILHAEQAAHVAPWSEHIFQMCFKVGFHCYGMEDAGQLVGFIVFSIAVQECHILNLAILPDYQHQGRGSELLAEALRIAQSKKCQLVYLEVRQTNAHAIALYERFSFQQINIRKNYYVTETGSEDALVLALVLKV